METTAKDASWILMIDLDDTLLPSGYLFVEAALQSALLITHALRPTTPFPNDLFSFHHELDVRMIREFGYGSTRYVESWKRTYRHFAALAGVGIDAKVEKDIDYAAMVIERGPFALFEGVIETLSVLRRDGHQLHLVTVGEERLQRAKVSVTGLEAHFDAVHVTPMQKRTQMQAIAGSRRDRVMMVGDSFRSDIIPAVELGFTAVHVPGCRWSHASEVDVPEGSYRQVSSIRDLPAMVRRLEGLGATDGKVAR
jgi:putative hydrolase of the HAD superfamily